MDEQPYLSLYLRANTIYIFRSAIKILDYPPYIRFLISQDGTQLLLERYDRKSLTSFKIPKNFDSSSHGIRVVSKKFCMILASIQNWDPQKSYRVPGKVFPASKVIRFDLSQADIIADFVSL